jgi:hypothetical protein
MEVIMKKLIRNFLSTLLCLCCSSLPLLANENIDKYAEDIPGIGLILNTIKFDGITISNFYFENNKKFIFVEPNQDFSACMHYSIDASALKTLKRHHLIIGLYDAGPQQCILHAYGIKDSEGEVCATLKAPEKKGVYQVRFCHSIGLTDDEAQKAWWRGEGPSAKTIVGIVVVK